MLGCDRVLFPVLEPWVSSRCSSGPLQWFLLQLSAAAVRAAADVVFIVLSAGLLVL